MTYVMSRKAYRELRKERMTHKEVIHYINATFGLRGKVTKIRLEG